MSEIRKFPLLSERGWRGYPHRTVPWAPRWIPWPIVEAAWREYDRCGHGSQSLERVAERGGFSIGEIDALLAGGGRYKLLGRPGQMEQFADEEHEAVRTGGEEPCPVCGLEFWRHPPCPLYLSYIGEPNGLPYLRRCCDGRLLKL